MLKLSMKSVPNAEEIWQSVLKVLELWESILKY
jgi:hypothetical protein